MDFYEVNESHSAEELEEIKAVRKNNKLLNAEQRALKQETIQMLSAYRKKYGLGSFRKITDACGVSTVSLRNMLTAIPVPYGYWERVHQTLTLFDKPSKS